MADDSVIRPLPDGDFRTRRAYLSDDAFAMSDGPSPPPTDPVPQVQWDGIANLSTDVLLRTTDYQGSLVAELYDLHTAWGSVTPLEPQDSEFMFDAALDASDDFSASLFMAAHGWYRQALGTLRSAIDTLAIAAGFAVRQDRRNLARWKLGEYEPKFGNALDFLSSAKSLRSLDQALGKGGLFGTKPRGVLGVIYDELCPYVHSQFDATNGAFWESNGPVWAPDAFNAVSEAYKDALAMAYVLLKVGWPSFHIPDDAWLLVDRSAGPWKDISATMLRRHIWRTTAHAPAPPAVGS